MNNYLNGLLRVDWSRVSPEVLDGLNSGKMILSDAKGTAYWAAGSGKTGIVAHLPMVEVSPDEFASAKQLLELRNLVKTGQLASMATTAVAAAVVVAVVVVATAYLASKIKKVEDAVDALAHTLDEQDKREYRKNASDYVGAIRAAQELLNSPMSERDIPRLAEQRINQLADFRQQMLGYVGALQSASSQDGRALPFMMEMLDLIPAALAVERELCLAAGMPGLAQARRDQAAPQFRQELATFRGWCEEQYRRLALGQDSHAKRDDPEQRAALQGLFNSQVHGILLGDWSVAASQTPSQSSGTEGRIEQPHSANAATERQAYQKELSRST